MNPPNPPPAAHAPEPAAGRPSNSSISDSPVTVVGIGASAGGLAALSDFFREIPPKVGLAYVIVQHLSPTHESILAELLGRHAAIPVHQAHNKMRVEPDCAYVIPPDTKMTLTDGHLTLVRRDPNARPPLPIDTFFRSLAEVQGNRTMGVILSGMGSDGALGVRAINGAGGITFAQEPATAGSDGMPLAAIATGSVDIVAPPADIATQLVHLWRHPYVRVQGGASGADGDVASPDAIPEAHGDGAAAERDSASANIPAADDHTAPSRAGSGGRTAADDSGTDYHDALAAIAGILRREVGVDFGMYKQGTFERRIRRRMALRKVDTFSDYVNVLRKSTSEVAALYTDLLIGVTRFFRDSEVFGVLSGTVLPRLLKHRSGGDSDSRPDRSPVRVWVPGCSTGEEAYSIAICLLEALDDKAIGTPIQIFATDLSESAISVARAGVYPQGIEADVTAERLSHFFTHEESGYRVNKAIRDCCIFARQNITADPPFSQLDIVSCRNVLIYLQPSVHARILSVFHYALKPGGMLLLGTSESTSSVTSLFTPIDKKHHVYVRVAGPSHPLQLDSATVRPVARATVNRTPVDESRERDAQAEPDGENSAAAWSRSRPQAAAVTDVQRAADRIVLGSYAPAAVVVDSQLLVIQFRGQTGSYIEPVPGTATLRLLKLVRPELAAGLRGAVNTARAEGRHVRAERIAFDDGARRRDVTLDVKPFRVTASDEQFFVVSFEESADAAGDPWSVDRESPDEARNQKGKPRARGGKLTADATDGRGDATVAPQLRSELENALKLVGELRQEIYAKELQLQAIAEEQASAAQEFQAATEELQSSNEELQSTNEELETSKEELQSLNEELTTLNDEMRLRNSEANRLNDDLTNLLNSIQVPVIMVDTQLRIRRFTAGSERMVNLIPADIGRSLGDIKANMDVTNLDEIVARVIATLEMTDREVLGRDKHWYLMTVRPYRTADHKIDGAVIIFYDIDERKRAAERSDGARRYAEAIVETVREPLLVLDGKLNVVSANHSFYENFRTSIGDTRGRAIFELADRQWDMPWLRSLLQRVASDGDAFNDVQVERDFATLGQRTMLLTGRRVIAARDGLPLILLAIEDITERKDADDALARANSELAARAGELEITSADLREKTAEAQASSRAKSDFLTTMSHELRTPLNAIGGYAQLLDMGIHGPVTDAQRADLARITYSQAHLMGLINEILNFAKLEAGGVAIDWADVNVAELLASVEAMVALQMKRKGLRFRVLGDDDQRDRPVAVRGDPDKIQQILLNLLTNALKFTASGGSVDVMCDANDGYVSIIVLDSGVGISAEHKAAIFEPFIQVNPSLTRPNDGLGLGLAISRELARAMGGDVTVESTVGAGSTFRLTLPRVSK